MADSISLLGGIRENLQSLQRTTALQGVAERNLATGRKVSSAIDNPTAYFQARSLSNRATDLASVKDTVNQGISALGAAEQGVTAIGRLLAQLKAVAESAGSAPAAERGAYARQFNDIRGQIDQLARDSGYQGSNLLAAGSPPLTVRFESGSVEVAAVDASAAGLGVAEASEAAFNTEAAIAQVQGAITELRSIGQQLGNNLQTLTIRGDYTQAIANTLAEGADKLVLADPAEEAVSLLALQTRQQLSQAALSIANESQRSLLAMF